MPKKVVYGTKRLDLAKKGCGNMDRRLVSKGKGHLIRCPECRSLNSPSALNCWKCGAKIQ